MVATPPWLIPRRVSLLAAAAVICLTTIGLAQPATRQLTAGQNIARGAKYTLSPMPGYAGCTDPGDVTQLTDGQLTEGYFWAQKGTVGWQNVPFVTITIDLGRIQPISGVSFRTAAGVAGVLWPAVIRIHVSDDGKTYYDVGDLIELSDEPTRLPQTYAVHRFSTSKLTTHGRYVRFLVIPNGPFLFTDEIQVFRGSESLLRARTGRKPVASSEAVYSQYKRESGIRRRFSRDADGVAAAIRNSSLHAATRERLLQRVDSTRMHLLETVDSLSRSPMRAVLPFNDAHASLFCIQAESWKALGRPAISAWAARQWDPLDLFAPPPSETPGRIEVHTMLGEYRSAAFSLANATDKPTQVAIRFGGLSGSPLPAYITVHAVAWTDTVSGQPVAAALPLATREADGWRVSVLPGLVQQVWLTFHVTDLPAGEQNGMIIVSAIAAGELRIPIHLDVYPLQFPAKTTLWLGGWDYSDRREMYGLTPENHRQFVEQLQRHFVNAPWATAQVLMRYRVTRENPPVVDLDTRALDGWLEQWPGAAAYLVFAEVGDTFAGARMGTDAFNRRVGAWISACVRHLKVRGVRPEQLGLLLVDEPSQNAQADVIVAWARAIHAAEPHVLIWEDPAYRKPWEARPELFEVCDILCPYRRTWLSAGKEFGEFYLAQQKRGKTLQFYSCMGPVRLLDPYSYYRLQAWHCWQIGATGSFFWAFGDTGGASSWNEYLASRGPDTPLFIDDQSVTTAKHMEAIREGVEDYECLVMLRKAVDSATAAGRSGATVAKARVLLAQAADAVLAAPGAEALNWHSPKDRTKADTVRIELLEALTESRSDK
jgi:hypothetical protein